MEEQQKKGFTIIELMLAMAFLGTMLVAIAALIMRVTSIYQKGLALRAVNTNGREIISDLTRTITSSPTHLKVNPEYGNSGIDAAHLKAALANYYLSVEDGNHTEQYSGIFCTGSYSYVWNNAPTITASRDESSSNDGHLLKIKLAGAGNEFYIPKLARFPDTERYACAHNETTSPTSATEYSPASMALGEGRSITMDDITELINDDDMDLALYDFRIIPATQNETTKQIFLSGSFILATIRGGVNIQSNGDFCTGDNKDIDSEFSLENFDYCAVNKFNFSARATGEATITNRNGE
ncbi:prepilin-type N-terminal cleavage/methylation domain-containing protein [Candidatus Saccharibacteria bacterium]|nr:prepilin-type N-terminal cleavage/methylation domain-containing protein [Candidatus Saccharibacteria bacterium]